MPDPASTSATVTDGAISAAGKHQIGVGGQGDFGLAFAGVLGGGLEPQRWLPTQLHTPG
jgi:hypothetical protein